jgi:hypothetical protein
MAEYQNVSGNLLWLNDGSGNMVKFEPGQIVFGLSEYFDEYVGRGLVWRIECSENAKTDKQS